MAFSTWIDRTRWARNTWAMLAIFILVMANVVDMVSPCCPVEGTPTLWISLREQLPAHFPTPSRHSFGVALRFLNDHPGQTAGSSPRDASEAALSSPAPHSPRVQEPSARHQLPSGWFTYVVSFIKELWKIWVPCGAGIKRLAEDPFCEVKNLVSWSGSWKHSLFSNS